MTCYTHTHTRSSTCSLTRPSVDLLRIIKKLHIPTNLHRIYDCNKYYYTAIVWPSVQRLPPRSIRIKQFIIFILYFHSIVIRGRSVGCFNRKTRCLYIIGIILKIHLRAEHSSSKPEKPVRHSRDLHYSLCV